MNSCNQNEHNGSISTEYHSPLLSHPHNFGAHVEDSSSPTVSENIAVNPSSANCENQAATPRTSHCSRQVKRRQRRKLKKLADMLAVTKYSRNQLPVDVRPQELAVHSNIITTPMTSFGKIENAFSSTSKVANQTSVVASAMANMSGEHSQSTDDKGPRNQQEAYTGPELQDETTVATRHGETSTISMAIRRSDFLGTEFNVGDIEKIQMGLHKMIDKHSSNNFSPHFEDYSIQNDALIVHCANEATVRWLSAVCYNNDEVFAGFRVVKASELPKIRVALKTRDVLTCDPMVFLKRLQRQNSNLHTRHWTTAGSPTMELDLQSQQLFHCWVFKIDQGSAEVIKAANMMAYTGLSKGTFEFLPDVDSPKEIVIKQEAEPSST